MTAAGAGHWPPGRRRARRSREFAASVVPRSIDQVARLKVSLAGFLLAICAGAGRNRAPGDLHVVIQVLFGWNGDHWGCRDRREVIE